MKHTCTEMEGGSKVNDNIDRSCIVPLKYDIIWSDYSKRFELRSQLHIELAGISYCPFCGTDLKKRKEEIEV